MAARTSFLLLLVSAAFAVDATNTTLIVYTTLEKPFVEVSEGQDEYTGLFVDILHELSKTIGMDFDIRTTTGPSYKTAHGQWTGVVQKVISKEGDLGGPLTITSVQERVVDHTKPIMASGIVLVAKKPARSASNSFWLFLKPFRVSAWVIIVIFTLLACGLLFFLMRRWSMNGKSKPPPELQCLRCFFYSYGLTISFLYIAHLTAMIPYATEDHIVSPIQSVNDLVQQTEIRYGVVRNGHAHNFFMTSAVPIFEQMYKFMSTTDGLIVDTIEEGIEKIRSSNGNYVFIMDSSKTADYYINQKPCDLYKLGPSLTAQGLGIVTSIGSQYRDTITLAILQLTEEGVMYKLENKWLHVNGSCAEFTPGKPREGPGAVAMGPDGTLGPVLVLVVGILLSGVIRLVRMWRKKNGKKPTASEEENVQ